MVGHCIEISNLFLKDFEVVVLFVEWLGSPPFAKGRGQRGGNVNIFEDISPPPATIK